MTPAPLPELPAAIRRDQVLQALEVLGLDPEHLLSVTFHRYGVEVDVYALTPEGQRYFLGGNAWRPDERDRDHDRVATHRVCIPVAFSEASPGTAEGGNGSEEAP